jgi:pimeloyl-ACP methyl ester carboxylesterase
VEEFEMSMFKTSDGVNLFYDIQGEGKPILFIAGWSCSTHFFDKNIPELARDYQVIAMDLRGHGQSEKPKFGHRISRYAKDVRDLLEKLDIKDVTAVGWSMGVAVLWSYYELFGDDRISKLVCVDQSPAQYTGPDWQWGQNGCYDVEMYLRLCAGLTYEEQANAEGTVFACMHRQPTEEEVKFLSDEIMKCPAFVKIDIMRDHTNLDWRDLLPQIKIPTLVCVARKSAIFDWEGSAYVGEKIPGAETVFFEECGHMLFWENPEKFNQSIRNFVG